MEPIKDKHDVRIFWLIASCLFISFVYIFMITFMEINKENVRFADTTQGFILGTVVAGCLAFYIGGNSPAMKKQSNPGTTAEVSATITTEPETKTDTPAA